MATQGIQGLFGGMGTPEEMQRQLVEQKAMQFATMTPQQQMSYNIYKNTGNLGRGLAGAFGVDVQDPAIRRATMLRQMASQYDTTTPEGLRQMAAALQGTDPELGYQVMQRADALELSKAKISSEHALTKQREREKAAADPFQKLVETGKYTPASLKAYKDSNDVADLQFKESDAKTTVIKADGRTKLINSQTGEVIADLGVAGKTLEESLSTGLSKLGEAMVGAQAKAAGAEAGKGVGKQSVEIQGKYTAMKSIDDALKMANKGIFAGGYGPTMEATAKYSKGVVGGQKTLENTEQFRAYIGDVVIPRLQEFGGNDSVEELKYLRSVTAGDTTLEAGSIKKILKRAKEKIDEGVKRLEAQQEATIQGKPLPLGPVKGTVKWSDLKE
jgi:hypothetical protein